MRLILPLTVLLAVVLGCNVPRSSQTESSEPRPKIAYSKPTFESDYGWTTLNFEIVNESPKRLDFLKLNISFYDKSGTLIDSEMMYPNGTSPIEPGQRVAAKVMTESDRRFSTYRMSFSAKSDRPFEDVQVDAVEIEPDKPEPKKKKK